MNNTAIIFKIRVIVLFFFGETTVIFLESKCLNKIHAEGNVREKNPRSGKVIVYKLRAVQVPFAAFHCALFTFPIKKTSSFTS